MAIKLHRSMSGRRDFRSYALLLVGLAFVWAGVTVDPAKNCDESGRECAPWPVHVGLLLGVLAATSGAAMLVANCKWGVRVDTAQRRLFWWDTRISPETGSISLDDVARIKLRPVSDGADHIFFYDRAGELMPVPREEIFPYPHEPWVRELQSRFTHILVTVEHD